MSVARVLVRVAAVGVAVALVAGGVALRGGDDGPSVSVAGPDAPPSEIVATTLGCDATLVALCRAAVVDVEAVASGDPAAVDLTRPYVGAAHVVADAAAAASRAGRSVTGTTTELGSSPLVLAGREDRVAALVDLCGEPADAACAAGVVADGWSGAYAEWGRSSLAVAAADDDPVTVLLAGVVVGAAEGSLDTRSLAATAPLLSAIAADTTVDRRSSRNRLTATVSTPALTDFRVGLLADWLALADLPRAEGLAVTALDPAWSYAAVLWLPDGAGGPDAAVDDLRRAFADATWDDPGAHEPAPTSPPGLWEAVHDADAIPGG